MPELDYAGGDRTRTSSPCPLLGGDFMTQPDEARLSVAEAARRAGMTIEGIRDAIRRGKLKAKVIATRPVYAIKQLDLGAYLQEADKEPRGRPRSKQRKRRWQTFGEGERLLAKPWEDPAGVMVRRALPETPDRGAAMTLGSKREPEGESVRPGETVRRNVGSNRGARSYGDLFSAALLVVTCTTNSSIISSAKLWHFLYKRVSAGAIL